MTEFHGPALRAAGFRLDTHGYPMCDRTGYHGEHRCIIPGEGITAECAGLARGEFDFGSTPDALYHPSDHAHMVPGTGGTVRPIRNAHDYQDEEG